MEVGTMYLHIKKLFIILFILCFWVGCTQVKHIVTDVKGAITGEKEGAQKAPVAADKETPKESSSPPAKTKPKDTKTTPPSKKGTQKKTEPSSEDVFGPK